MTEPDYTIAVPRPHEWLSANARRHWRVKADIVKAWRDMALIVGRKSGVPALGPSRVIAELHMTPRRRSRIDPANYQDTAKPVIDGLVDAGIWPDDSADWVTGPDMRLGPPSQSEWLVIQIWGKCCCDAAEHHHHKGKP